MQKSHPELVEIARSRLTDLFKTADVVIMPVEERDTAYLLECLDELLEQYERDGRPHSGQGQSLANLAITNAWRRGLASDGIQRVPDHAYLEKLEELGRRCSNNPAAFDALALHASAMVAEDQCMPAPLRRFVRDYLIGEIDRHRPPGRPRKTALPDLVVTQVVEELVKTYGIKAVGNVAADHKGSACAIVAQALKKLGRQPNSFSAVEKAWFASRRAERD